LQDESIRSRGKGFGISTKDNLRETIEDLNQLDLREETTCHVFTMTTKNIIHSGRDNLFVDERWEKRGVVKKKEQFGEMELCPFNISL
jgi:hypothetical protein